MVKGSGWDWDGWPQDAGVAAADPLGRGRGRGRRVGQQVLSGESCSGRQRRRRPGPGGPPAADYRAAPAEQPQHFTFAPSLDYMFLGTDIVLSSFTLVRPVYSSRYFYHCRD